MKRILNKHASSSSFFSREDMKEKEEEEDDDCYCRYFDETALQLMLMESEAVAVQKVRLAM